ncbi:uncharacterized protein TM35_000751020 [Trypanosoma theileri]|uniref:Uncharacterized protein n=1 Tax=Trypanosoma theileri TaxID=67003 RepID=A0A1X0NF33_9TRYP|nr:uncharacterized protein TM35_000751020 [Trypanosoma theileri]ORC83335.1 hypothetical protein TM35_000751020 [Trypanosoma theileri]
MAAAHPLEETYRFPKNPQMGIFLSIIRYMNGNHVIFRVRSNLSRDFFSGLLCGVSVAKPFCKQFSRWHIRLVWGKMLLFFFLLPFRGAIRALCASKNAIPFKKDGISFIFMFRESPC